MPSFAQAKRYTNKSSTKASGDREVMKTSGVREALIQQEIGQQVSMYQRAS